MKRRFLSFLLPLCIAAFFSLLDASGVLARPDGAAYDLLYRLRATPKPDPRILLVDVDDESARLVGAWPWTRDHLADGLVLLREMNVRSVVVDVPLAQRSVPALDASALRQELPVALDKEFLQIQSNIQSLYDAIRRGSVRPQDSSRYVSDLVGLVAMAKVRLFNAATGIERDDDALLGQALGFFGNAYVPFDLLPTADVRTDVGLLEATKQRQAIAVTVSGRDPSLPASGIRPAVLPIVTGARGGGFAGISAGHNGVFRSAPLVVQWQGSHFVSVAAAAALEILSPGELRLSADRALLWNQTVAPGKAAESIPLDAGGEVLLSWPRTGSGDGFRHISWAHLIQYGRGESQLAFALHAMDDLGYLTYLRSNVSLIDVYERSERLRRDMLAASINTHNDEWIALRAQFFTLCSQLLNGDAEARILADTDRALAAADPGDQDVERLRAQRSRVSALFSQARATLTTLVGLRSSLQEILPGSLCIIALARDTDPRVTGKTPFGAPATEAAAQAALVNTILTGSRVRAGPPWIGYLIAAVLGILIALATFHLRSFASFAVGVAATAVFGAAAGGIFFLWDAFIQPFPACAAGLACASAISLLHAGERRRATRAVRIAFRGSVSAEGLRSLLSTPEILSPRGKRQAMTIIALAEKGLWGGSVGCEPHEVMRQLSAYHKAVGEVVRSLDGMIGGAGADRLTAYFGAPLGREDHAVRACRAACRIRVVERELNRVSSPPLGTRMGIDSGVCIVGALGSHGMPAYSVVGEPADLAARLEGLNGTFGTSILVTERVRAAIGDAFIVRRVGIARVAGPDAGVRVYELAAEAEAAEAGIAGAMDAFEKGLLKFEARDFAAALSQFAAVLAVLPGDGPARAYAERCRQLTAGGASTSFPT